MTVADCHLHLSLRVPSRTRARGGRRNSPHQHKAWLAAIIQSATPRGTSEICVRLEGLRPESSPATQTGAKSQNDPDKDSTAVSCAHSQRISCCLRCAFCAELAVTIFWGNCLC